MEFNIVWSKFAEYQIDNIYDYYNRNATNKVALNIVREIIKSVDILKTSQFIGKREELLVDRVLEYRRLIHKNYKIIYTIDTKEKSIKISDVFDMRQNPIKIKQ